MNGISNVGGNNYTSNYYAQSLSSGNKIHQAADGASELAILKKQDLQAGGYRQGTENLQSGKNTLNIADGAMDGITAYIQRMRDLAIKAINGLCSSDDRASMQAEVDQLKQGISDVVSATKYNESKMLDGSTSDKIIISDAEGASRPLSVRDSSLSALGLEDFDLTGPFDISVLDNALEQVSQNRASVGAQMNAYDHAVAYNSAAEYNTVSAQSASGDTEYGEYISKLQKENQLQSVSVMMQKKEMEQNEQNVLRMFQ